MSRSSSPSDEHLTYGRETIRHGAVRRWTTRAVIAITVPAVVILSAAAPLVWLASGDARAVAAAQRLGGTVKTRQVGPDWLQRVLGIRLGYLLTRADEISLRGLKLSDDDIVSFSRLTDVRDLDLYTTDVSDKSLAMISKLRSLEALHLGRSHVTNEAVRLLKDMPNLTYLGFQGANISDAALKHISEFPKLQTLVLAETHVTDSGLELLRRCQHLKTLFLSERPVTSAGVSHLQDVMKELSIIVVDPALPANPLVRQWIIDNHLDPPGIE